MLEYQRACPQENHPDKAGLHLKLPPLFSFFLLSCFPLILCYSHLISTLHVLLHFFLYFVIFSFDLPRSFYSVSRFSQSLFLSLRVFTSYPISLNDPQCCWISFPCSQNCKVSWDQRSRKQRQRTRETESVLWCRYTRPPSLHSRNARHSGRGQRNWLALFPLLSEWY